MLQIPALCSFYFLTAQIALTITSSINVKKNSDKMDALLYSNLK